MRFSISALVVLLAAFATEPPLANASDSVREAQPETGTRIRRPISFGAAPYPLTKPYERFSAEEVARFKDLYTDMKESDEPPFPRAGFASIIQELAHVAGYVGYAGHFSVRIIVTPQGRVRGVELVAVTDAKAARSLASVLFRPEYKPAKCDGVACEMKLPLTLVFE